MRAATKSTRIPSSRRLRRRPRACFSVARSRRGIRRIPVPAKGSACLLFVRPVHQNLHALERHHASPYQGVELWQEGVDFFRRVHDLDHDREIFGESKNTCRVNPTGATKPFDATQHGGAGETLAPGELYDRLVARMPFRTIALPDEDAQQLAVAGHHHTASLPRTTPITRLIKPTTTLPAAFASAGTQSPVWSRRHVSSPKVEKVV